MKKLTRFMVVSAIAAAVALPAYAQNTQPQGGAAQTAQTPQTDEQAKTQLYNDFLAARKKWKDSQTAKSPTEVDDYKAAYDIAKQYVDKYGAADDEYAKYVKGFVAGYENFQKTARKGNVDKLIKDKKYAEAFAAGKQVLAEDPNDLATLFLLSRGALIANDESLNADATTYAKKALELVGQGKTFQEGTPIPNKDEVLAILNYALGWFARKSSPSESATYFYQAAQYNSGLKKEAQTYDLLAAAYEKDYETVAKDYAAKYPDDASRQTPEGKAATDKLNAVTDRLIDAYAREVAYAGTDPKNAPLKTRAMARLTELYKFRHDGSDAGLNEFIASVTSKPLPTLSSTQPSSTTSSSAQPAGATN
jgi:hypothetical protein